MSHHINTANIETFIEEFEQARADFRYYQCDLILAQMKREGYSEDADALRILLPKTYIEDMYDEMKETDRMAERERFIENHFIETHSW